MELSTRPETDTRVPRRDSRVHHGGCTGDVVALKRIRMDVEKDGFPVTCLRELKILKRLEHPNIVKLKEVVTGSSLDRRACTWMMHVVMSVCSVFLVFEYCDHDFSKLIMRSPNSRTFTISQIKCILRQVCLNLVDWWMCVVAVVVGIGISSRSLHHSQRHQTVQFAVQQ